MWKIKEVKILLRQGDITESKTDAIVNAANTKLLLGAGVAGAIRKKGGPAIQAECNKIREIPLGEASITNSGNLSAKYVIHAASMHLGGRTTKKSLRDSLWNSLLRAKEVGIRSISFPAIGTGIAGFPIKECAKIFIDVFKTFLSTEESNLETIEVVLFSENDFLIFKNVFDTLL
ncbi:MAG: macro domain-containing protein [Candidatus Heimdallarchaeaceae archaeon]